MNHLDLFSGIGGFALAATWAGYTPVQFVEIEPFAQRVLAKHWPEVPIHDDIRTFDATGLRGTVELLTGGFPCQPYSVAGKRAGKDDDRALWPEMRRVIAEARPRWVVAENVPGFIGLGLDDVLTDLEALGYETGALVVPTAGVGAPHIRQRLWVVAHTDGDGEPSSAVDERPAPGRLVPDAAGRGPRCRTASWPDRQPAQFREGVSDTGGGRCEPEIENLHAGKPNAAGSGSDVHDPGGRRCRPPDGQIPAGRDGSLDPGWWAAEPCVRVLADGLPRGLARHRVSKLKALGNAIVPAVAYEIIRHLETAS